MTYELSRARDSLPRSTPRGLGVDVAHRGKILCIAKNKNIIKQRKFRDRRGKEEPLNIEN